MVIENGSIMNAVIYKPIGIIHSPHKNTEGIPIQPAGAKGVSGTVVLNPEFASGLKDLEGFSHIILIYDFHLSDGYSLELKPFLDDTLRGVFSTRAPRRPNSIGLSVVKLVRIEKNILYLENVDIIDGTPLLDIKPYVSEFDGVENERSGWLSERAKHARKSRSDDRFR
jgi:tRNA-Thr(GGU) m(6)t(6)A37 methyltransferase TsaA